MSQSNCEQSCDHNLMSYCRCNHRISAKGTHRLSMLPVELAGLTSRSLQITWTAQTSNSSGRLPMQTTGLKVGPLQCLRTAPRMSHDQLAIQAYV